MSVSMLTNIDIVKFSRRYAVQTLVACAVLVLAVLSVSKFAHVDGLVSPLVISAVFALVVELADTYLWSRLARNGGKMLPTYYSAVSSFRMLLALFTLLGCYIAVGRDAMLRYCLVFMVFYLWCIIHHSVFFSRVSNNHTQCDNDNK